MAAKGVVHDVTSRHERRNVLGAVMERVSMLLEAGGFVEVVDERNAITVKRRRPTRSLKANSYYWAAVVPWVQDFLREEWGEPDLTPLETHAEMKRQFLDEERVRVTEDGEVLRTVKPGHTPECDTASFSEFVDKVLDFLAKWSPERYQGYLKEAAFYRGEADEEEFGGAA